VVTARRDAKRLEEETGRRVPAAAPRGLDCCAPSGSV
jgi:hypothetical protein